jgi:hypothetical protein
MFTISPIGSCRITTPLKNGQSRHGFRLNLGRCYGYCHSPSEAVQLARFMRGDVELPADVWPLISRSHRLDKISAQRHDPSHLYVVELASAKEITIDGVSVQLNYLKLAFGDFFANGSRLKEFWALAQTDDGPGLKDFLAREWSATEEQRVEAETLERIRLRWVTRNSLRRDIADLRALLPNILFVTHVDARKPDGSTISSRSDFIQLVREEVNAAGLNFYDPTDLMAEFGQAAAIEDESAGLAHFTAPFGDALMDDWMRRYVAPSTDRISSRAGGSEKMLRQQVQAAIARGEHRLAAVRLQRLSERSATSEALHASVSQDLAKARSALSKMAKSLDPEKLSAKEINDILAEAGKLGLFDLALDFAARAPGGFAALPAHLLVSLALQAEDADEDGDAFEFALAAFFHNPGLPRARALLLNLALRNDFSLSAVLPADRYYMLFSGLDAGQKLRLLQLENIAPYDAVTDEWTPTEVLGMASLLCESGDLEATAKILAAWRKANELHHIRDEGLAALVADCAIRAQNIEDRAQRIRALAALMDACPRNPMARTAIRDVRVDLVERIRAAGRSGDLDTLEALSIEAQALPAPLPEFDLWHARLRFDRGEFEEVLKLGPVAKDHMPEKISVWVLLMRAALNANERGKAAEFAGRVLELACSKTDWLRVEAEAVLSAEPAGT